MTGGGGPDAGGGGSTARGNVMGGGGSSAGRNGTSLGSAGLMMVIPVGGTTAGVAGGIVADLASTFLPSNSAMKLR